ncbi:hypothetical protein JCM19235_2273 [Vibrio maritimus]|uniref:Uncharacterized protein n=1 Tax=Vibrio maritimus TaxID=990268 RepID=A0A090RTV1_9VIBR|nr:hypothetical protein JCM19235_2273 [Vibrio maritimus]
MITTTSVSSNLEQYRDTVTYNVMGEDAKSGDTITVAASNDRHTQDGTFAVYAKVGATQDMIKAGHAEVITTIKLAAPRI